MNNKKSLISLFMLCGSVSTIYAADAQPWKSSNVASYTPGTLVTEDGSTYKCKSFPEGAWCTLSAYEPIGVYGLDAWDTDDTPAPTPEILDQHIVATVDITGGLPTGATIEFVGPDNLAHVVSNGSVNLDYAEGGSQYSIKVKDGEGTVSPSTIVVDSNSSSFDLKYRDKRPTPPVPPIPQPTSDCDAYDVAKVAAYSDGSVYQGKDFAKFDGGIYEAKWWTQNAAPGTDSVWQYCGQSVETKVSINASGLPSTSKSFVVVIGGKSYLVGATKQSSIVLGEGSYDVTVPNVLDTDGSKSYVADAITPNPIVVNSETAEVSLNISFKSEMVETVRVNLEVSFAEGTSPSLTTAKITNTGGFEQTIQLQSGVNITDIPSEGEFTITPDSYDVSGTSYVGNTVTIKDGKVDGSNKIAFAQASDVLVGYLPVWGGSTNPTISQSAEAGYNVVAVAFADVKGESAVEFNGGSFASYGNDLTGEALQTAIKADITKAKKDNGLKYALISVGGENNTFDPQGADMSVVSSNIVTFLQDYGFDGIDFDLEQVPFTDDQLLDLMANLKKDMPSIIMSGAPQVNEVQGSLQYVNTGTEQVYNKALNAGLFDYMFVQAYNTGGNFVNDKGDFSKTKSEGFYDVYDPEFITNSFMALKKMTPDNTKIVMGEPSTANAAGQAQIFHGSAANNTYKAMCEQFAGLSAETSYAGAMTWQIVFDKDNSYSFANAVKAAETGDCQNI